MTPDEISKLIPDEVVDAARDALFSDKGMRGAIAAGLTAWPGMDIAKPIPHNRLVMSRTPTLILPLTTQENTDAEDRTSAG